MEESILMWNRLEGTLRNETQIDAAMRFEIRDPLWMLTRQWQFGELDGEDAGTAAFTYLEAQVSALQSVGSAASFPQAPDFDYLLTPPELPAEQETWLPDVADRLEIGRQWERLLLKRLPPGKGPGVVAEFRMNKKFRFENGLPADPDRGDRFHQAQQFSDTDRLSLLACLSGRALDGFSLYRELKSGKKASIFLDQVDDQVDSIGKEFMAWFERTYNQNPGKPTSWHPQHLEYQTQLAFSGVDGTPRTLRQEAYYGKGMSWHSLTPKSGWNGQGQLAFPKGSGQRVRKQVIIPTSVRFGGMPALRLWEMEDATVNFSAIQTADTELNKMLFAEFGLIFGNDWLLAPMRLPGGTLPRLSAVVVTDIFGNETRLSEIQPDANWAFFQMPVAAGGERRLYLANSTEFIETGPPVEKVLFLRDEMANLVWGVEEVVSNPFGGGRDGERLAKAVQQWVRTLEAPPEIEPEGALSSEGWVYKAGTLMAENRIPFIPVATSPTEQQNFGKRTVLLRRAALPRVAADFTPTRVRPRTVLLGWNGSTELEKPDPLFVFEEEVPRTGMELRFVWKRARWFDGRTLTWLARQKSVGRGEIDANFRFDVLRKDTAR